jgi:hypothetical protein
MQFDWMSSIIGFLIGTATGAAGKYLADKFTDQRRKAESTRQLKQEFLNIKRQMPELITEFKNDLSKKDQKFIREFFVLANRKVCLGGSSKPRFVYYEEEHKDLRGKIDILENQGFLIDVTTGNVPIYRMTEEFVQLVNRYG